MKYWTPLRPRPCNPIRQYIREIRLLRLTLARPKANIVDAAMIAAYRAQDWAATRQGIADCRALEDGRMAGFYDLITERVDEFVVNPPPANWSGVYVAESK